MENSASINSMAERPLSYSNRLQLRALSDIQLVVLHCTELPDLETARQYGEVLHYPESSTGNSGHFYINRDGQVESWVGLERIAHHTRGFNEKSVGIELVNTGRFPDWFDSNTQRPTEPYPEGQILSLIALLNVLCRDLPSLGNIAGHEDLDREQVPASDNPDIMVYRKRDPGPMFPWPRVMKAVQPQLKKIEG